MRKIISREIDAKQLRNRQGDYADMLKLRNKVTPPECYFLKGVRENLKKNEHNNES